MNDPRELEALRRAAPDASPESRSLVRAAGRELTFTFGAGCASTLALLVLLVAYVLWTR